MSFDQILHSAPMIGAVARPANQRELYNTRWKRKAQNLLLAQAEGKFLDRKERRLAAHFVLWQSTQTELEERRAA